ncbi:hypothetical protein BHE74_00037976 [Ensete ventricosum]|nr:hypothetical protein BHE74_00037976 [Ensete ventricosum]
MKAWMINDGCASGMTLISFVKRERYRSRGSSSFCLITRRDMVVGFGQALARKLALNSLASWSKEWMEASDSRLYHFRAIPHRVVGKVWHIMASNMTYKAIYALRFSDVLYCYALKKLVESEESVLRSGRLCTDGLGMDVGRLTTSPEMARLNFDGGQGRSSASCVVEG